MDTESAPSAPVDQEIAAVVAQLIGQSRLSQRALVERSGLSKDQLSRALKGTRQLEIEEAVALLSAAELPARGAITLALYDRPDLAVEWCQSGLSGFLEALIRALPDAIASEIGESSDRINPRWGQHAARFVAQRIARHIEDVLEREEKLGEFSPGLASRHGGLAA